MRSRSVYSLDCICGHHIESETTTLDCPECYRPIEIDWPAKPEENQAPDGATFRIAA
jgi:hypothetical protein